MSSYHRRKLVYPALLGSLEAEPKAVIQAHIFYWGSGVQENPLQGVSETE